MTKLLLRKIIGNPQGRVRGVFTSPPTVKRCSSFTFLALVLCTSLALARPAAALTTTAENDLSCAGTRYGDDLNCNAGEFSTIVSLTNAPGSPSSCVVGDSVTLIGQITLSDSNTDRYNIGFFTGENGNDPRLSTGQCSVATFPTTPSPWLNLDGNACGDYLGGGVDLPIVENIKVLCAGNATGQLIVPYTVTYDQNATVCTGPSDILPGSKSKCNSGTAYVSTTTFTVNGSVTITKQTLPDGDSQAFAFTASGTHPVMTADQGFNLSDNGSKVVRMAISDTPGTLTITEAATAGWESTTNISCTNPDGSSSTGFVTTNGTTRTITAVLSNANPNAVCTITNNKRSTITVNKYVLPSSDSGKFNLLVGGTTVAADISDGGTGSTTVSANSAVTISETAGTGTNLADYDTTYSCSNGSSGTGTSVGITPSSGEDVSCTFTNTRRATVTVNKTLSPATDAGTFNLFVGSATVAAGVGDGGSGSTSVPGNVAVSIGEGAAAGTFLGNYSTTYSCTDGTAGSGTSFSVTPAPGQAVNCTFTNTAKPDISLVKMVQAISDPVHGTSNPYSIPGSVMRYTILATNTGPGPADADSVTLTDQIPGQTDLVVSASPVIFIDGAVSSGLTFNGAADVVYQDASDTPISPSADGNGVDPAVRKIIINPKSTFLASNGADHPSFSVIFYVRVR